MSISGVVFPFDSIEVVVHKSMGNMGEHFSSELEKVEKIVSVREEEFREGFLYRAKRVVRRRLLMYVGLRRDCW